MQRVRSLDIRGFLEEKSVVKFKLNYLGSSDIDALLIVN